MKIIFITISAYYINIKLLMMDNANGDFFSTYIHYIKQGNPPKTTKWNDSRITHMTEVENNKKIISTELCMLENYNPLDLIDRRYQSYKYSRTLLEDEMNKIKEEYNDKAIIKVLVGKCESFGRIQTILECLLNFLTTRDFERIMYVMGNMDSYSRKIDNSLTSTVVLKEKIKTLRKHSLDNSVKFISNKQKLSNLLKIHGVVTKLREFGNLFSDVEKTYKKDRYLDTLEKISYLKKELCSFKASMFERMGMKLNIFDEFNDKCDRKMMELTQTCSSLFSSLFLTKKERKYPQIFTFYHSQGDYLERFKITFNKNLFSIIKETLALFAEGGLEMKEGIRDLELISSFKFDDINFIIAIHQVLLNSAKVIENLWFYINIHREIESKVDEYAYIHQYKTTLDINKRIVTYFDEDEPNGGVRLYFEIIDKTFSELFLRFREKILGFNYRNIVYLSIYASLFLDYAQSLFKVEYSNYLRPQIVELLRVFLSSHAKSSLFKLGSLLRMEIWQPLPLLEDHDFFSEIKLQENAPFAIKPYLNIFNTHESFQPISRELFYSLLEEYAYGKITSFKPPEDINNSPKPKIKILESPLNYKEILICPCTKNLVDMLINFVSYLVLFDSISFEIFDQIFQIYDYFILSVINMFIDKKILSRLYEKVDVEDYKKSVIFKSKLEDLVDRSFFKKKYKNTRSFLDKTKKKLEDTYNVELNIIQPLKPVINQSKSSELCQTHSHDFFLPENTILLDDISNPYANFVETIVIYESLYTIYKILKRLKHFAGKLEFEFQQSYIENTIDRYKPILNEMRNLLYSNLNSKIFKLDGIMRNLRKSNWDPEEDDIDAYIMADASAYVNELYNELCERKQKIETLTENLPVTSRKRYYDEVFNWVKDQIIDSYSRIKKCSSIGRSSLLKDSKFLKSNLEKSFTISKKKLNEIFGEIGSYLNAWYDNEEQLFSYIKDTNINYRYIQGLLATGPTFIAQSRQAKNDMNEKIETIYLKLIEEQEIS